MTARSFSQVLGGGYGQRKSKANPDAPTDPVRANSYDVDDTRAKPGRQIGDGSAKEGWAWRSAQLATLEWLYEDQRKKGYRGEFRVQPTFLHVYKVMLREFLFVKNGDFCASAKAIAEVSGESEGTVKRCILVLEFWGFLSHVRRSRAKPDAEGQAGPQREQVANAYFFNCREQMPEHLWKVLWAKLVANCKQIRKLAVRAAQVITDAFNKVAKPAPREARTQLRMTIARVGLLVDRREEAAASTARVAQSARSGL